MIRLAQHRFFPCLLIAIMLVSSYWAGYWHGRTFELFKSSQRTGAIPESMTWGEFLKRTPHRP